LKGSASLCLCLAADTIEADLRLAAENRGRVDLLELRVDHLLPGEAELASRFPRLVDLPVILTVRRNRDGGRFVGEERDRVALIDRLAGPAAFAYVDIEEDLDAPALAARITGTGARIIRSLHDYTGVPHDFTRRVSRLARGPREIPKAAVSPKGTADLGRLLEAFAGLEGGEKILLGMGEVGFPTRVLAGRLGSFLCYSSPIGAAVAPGQVDPATLEDLYNFRSVGAETAVYGVIGNPVMHTRSPLIHNRGFTALGLNAVYVPFLVDDLEGFWGVADSLEINGLSVTVPHKGAVTARLGRSDELVKGTGACNTMTRARGRGAWSGTNTDVAGFLAPLRAAFGGEVPPGLGATVIGAGGAARAVVHALVGSGVRVLVLNRTVERGRALAVAHGVIHAGLDEVGFHLAEKFGDLVVQTTSVGMAPADHEDPAPEYHFREGQVVYELIYAPGMTKFLLRARSAGCRIVQGRQMLLEQAMEQFRVFTGMQYPSHLIEEMTAALD
jgi:3-dehydroquinate dehydratase / shikimate dehydrogenase